MTLAKKIVKKTVQVLSISIVAVELLVILALVLTKMSGNVPNLFGYSVYVIVSESMTPDLVIGDVIISRSFEGEELTPGQIVQYVGKTGKMKGKIITHRILTVTGEGDDRVIVTKGTANVDADPPITPDDIVGVMVYQTVVIDKLYAILSTTWGFILLVMLPMVGMIVSEIVRLMLEIKGEKNDQRDSQK